VTFEYVITFPVLGDGCFAGTIRYGTIGSRPIHAAACAECWAAVYDQPAFEDVVLWLRDHLAVIHGVHFLVFLCLTLSTEPTPPGSGYATKDTDDDL
jgi:hypothetical protein